MVAEELAKQEELAYQQYRDKLDAQARIDSEHALKIQYEFDSMAADAKQSQEAKDSEIARDVQDKLCADDMKSRKSLAEKDAQLARNMTTKLEREVHRRVIARKIRDSNQVFRTAAQVRKQWLNAEAEIEDVSRGICITIQLPFMRDLQVKVGRSQSVKIEARRLMAPNEVIIESDDEDSSVYIAEFFIDGARTKITDEFMSYEYSSDTGLLHVYIDNVHLEKMESKERTGMLSKFKNSFARVFGMSKGRKAEAK